SVAISSGVTAFNVRTSGIVIQDLTLQGGGVGVGFPVTSNNTQITRVTFNGNTSRGMEISANVSNPVTNVTIASSTFTTPNIGLRMASASQVTGVSISGTTFSNNLYGIYQANDGGTSKLTSLAISSCTFTNNTNYGIYAEEMR